jgi:membrane fusion protein (multidrug efflux system)
VKNQMADNNLSNQQGPSQGDERQQPNSRGRQNDQNRKAKVRRRWIILIVAAIIVIAGLIFGVPYYLYAVNHKSTDDAFIDAHISPVAARVAGHVWKIYVNDNQLIKQGDLLVELDPRDFQTNVGQARAKLTQAVSQVEFAKINVALTEIIAYAGLDEAKAAVSLAQANIESAKAGVAVAESQLKQTQADLVVARKIQQQAQAQVKAALPVAVRDQNDLKRYRKMYDTNSITPQQFDHAMAAAEVSAANLEDARKHAQVTKAQTALAQTAVKTAKENVHRAEAALSQAQANLRQADAQLASARSAPQKVAMTKSQLEMYKAQASQAREALTQAQLQLSYTKIYAPVAGRVSHKTAQLGAYIVAGQSLMSIVPQNVFITANYKETALTNMRPGQPAVISIDAYPGVKFHGFVDSIQAGSGALFSLLPPENATGNYIKVVQRVPVKIVFDPAPDQNEYYIVPGMSVIPRVDVSRHGQPSRGLQTAPPYTAWTAPFDSNNAEEQAQPAETNSVDSTYKK